MYVTVGDYRYDVLSSLNILRFDSTLVKINLVVLFIARVHNREETYREGAINSPKIFDWSKIHATLQI